MTALDIPARDYDKLDEGTPVVDSRDPRVHPATWRRMDEFDVATLPDGQDYARASSSEKADIRIHFGPTSKAAGLPDLRLRKLSTGSIGRQLAMRGKIERQAESKKIAEVDPSKLPVWAWYGEIAGKPVRGLCAAKTKQAIARIANVKYPYQLAVNYQVAETTDAEEQAEARRTPLTIVYRDLTQAEAAATGLFK